MATPKQNLFARALESYAVDVKRDEDPNSVFFTQVLSVLSTPECGDLSQQIKHSEEQLIDFIRDLDTRQRRSSTTRKISARLRPFVTGLSQYTACCDVMIQAAPSAAVLLYGGARVVLQLAENFQNCFETVLSIMDVVGERLNYYRVLGRAYEASADMQDRLVKTYKNIVSFWQKASKLFSRKGFKTLLRGIVKPLDVEWQKCRQALDDDTRHVELFAQATGAELARQKNEEQISHQQAELRKEIVGWIKARDVDGLDTRSDINHNLEIRHENTCEWLFEHPDMKKWLAAKASTAIWYSADPGAGKTITASSLARRLQDEGKRTATFFCSFNDNVRKKPISVFRSIALQLLNASDPIPETVKLLYKEDMSNFCPGLTDGGVALKVVESLIRQLTRVHIIVDGLDECGDVGLLLAALCHLLHAKTYGIVKWFFSSREDAGIRLALRKHNVTEIQAPEGCLISDIRKYLTVRLHDAEFVDHWASLSDGNFLWMSHMMPVIEGETSTCAEDLEEELETFPKGLTGCYARSLTHLSKRPEKHQQLARKVFMMAVGAAQPLRLSELTHALAASRGAADYSERSIPRAELIEELCSNLFKFDRGTNSADNDPFLKVTHKSVQDFFLQDPDNLDLPDPSIRQYFVTIAAANLELGQSALSYLSYERYNQPRHVSAVIAEGDHAFLRHAAIFWHRYLNEATQSQRLADKVVNFIRSDAFWTCVAVQCKIAPHLFAIYTNMGCGFKMHTTGLREDKERDRVTYSTPLPEWLEFEKYGAEGPRLIESFHRFIVEWHPVLTTHPSAVDQCVMDFEWQMNMPGRIPRQSSRVKSFTIPEAEPSPTASPIALVGLTMESDIMLIKTVDKSKVSRTYSLRTLQLPGTSGFSSKGTKVKTRWPTLAPISANSYVFSTFQGLDDECWLVDVSSLKAQKMNRSTDGTFTSAPGNHVPGDCGETWALNCNSSSAISGPFAGTYSAVAFHCSKEGFVDTRDTHPGQDSAYGSRTNSDDGSDGDSDDENEDDASELLKPTHDCMFIVRKDGPPIWHHWKSTLNLEAPCSFHPTEQLAVWSSAPHKLSVLDIKSGTVRSRILPEPVNVQFSAVCALRKEFHFSASGEMINYLLYTATTTEIGIRHTVSLSSYSFQLSELDEECGVILENTSPVKTVSYECTSPVQHPFILTHWEMESVYAALTPSLCSPKIIRMQTEGNQTMPPTTTEGIQTLRDPIYLPSSAPYRKPQLKVLSRNTHGKILVLAMHAEFATAVKPGASDAEIRKPPAVMTWDLDEKEDWRDWDDEMDGRNKSVKDNEATYAMLRGSYVDAGRRFDVPVRSGLDWRRKAFLSCA